MHPVQYLKGTRAYTKAQHLPLLFLIPSPTVSPGLTSTVLLALMGGPHGRTALEARLTEAAEAHVRGAAAWKHSVRDIKVGRVGLGLHYWT